jgi:hypothetical protein
MEIFNKKEIEKLDTILKLILPNINTNMPDANLILNDLDINNKIDFKFIEASKVLCFKIEKIENQEDLDIFKKRNFRDFSNFVNSCLILYYSNKEVLKNLKVGLTPPFPEGNYVKEGDIYLLEQVFLKDKMFKD